MPDRAAAAADRDAVWAAEMSARSWVVAGAVALLHATALAWAMAALS